MTPDERARLMTSFCGYDIAPDMVRLSRANLYLHGFPQPVIHEYDTLTSEERWDERYDVIMANPPFMTPKGGIRPHNRFSIKANRSEVLFVDYIAEHLNPGGRAGVIVPEGIIFQSQNAYKALRKMLIENYLWAVVSLPAGVFNPYSGVKTSILLLDRNLAKRTDELLFVKVKSDGFDLGAQRRPNGKNDLPDALRAILDFRFSIADSNHKSQITNPKCVAVPRQRLLATPDYNLSGDRYRATAAVQSKWPMMKLGEVCFIDPPKAEVRHLPLETEVSFVPMAALEEHTVNIQAPEVRNLGDVLKGYTYFRNGDVLLAKITPCFQNGKCVIANNLLNGIGFGTTEFIVIRPKTDKLLPEIVYYCVTRPAFVRRGLESMTGSAGQQRIPTNFVSEVEIPLPPLEIQRQMVAELDGYRRVIEGARQILAHYKPTIKIDPKWPVKPMGEVCDVRDGTHDSPKYHLQGFPLITSKNIKDGCIDFDNTDLISKDDLEKINKRSFVADGDILMPMIGTIGNPVIVRKDREFAVKNVALIKFREPSEVDHHYLKSVLESDVFASHLLYQSQGSSQKFVSLGFLRSLMIPLPPLSIQRKIVAELEAERVLVEANRKLIEIFEKKIQEKLAEIWGEE